MKNNLLLKKLYRKLDNIDEQLSYYTRKHYTTEELLDSETMSFHSKYLISLHKQRNEIINRINEFNWWDKLIYLLFK